MLSRRLLRLKAIKALYAHFKSESTDTAVSERNMLYSIDKTYDLYILMMKLIVDVADYALNRIELARRKHLPSFEDLHPNMRFVENRLIAQWRDSNAINDFAAKRGLDWSPYPELIKTLYGNLIASDYYKAYMESEKCTYRDDVKLVTNFYTHEIEDLDLVEEVLEEQSIMWADDVDFANIMVLRTLDDMKALYDGFSCRRAVEPLCRRCGYSTRF